MIKEFWFTVVLEGPHYIASMQFEDPTKPTKFKGLPKLPDVEIGRVIRKTLEGDPVKLRKWADMMHDLAEDAMVAFQAEQGHKWRSGVEVIVDEIPKVN